MEYGRGQQLVENNAASTFPIQISPVVLGTISFTVPLVISLGSRPADESTKKVTIRTLNGKNISSKTTVKDTEKTAKKKGKKSKHDKISKNKESPPKHDANSFARIRKETKRWSIEVRHATTRIRRVCDINMNSYIILSTPFCFFRKMIF